MEQVALTDLQRLRARKQMPNVAKLPGLRGVWAGVPGLANVSVAGTVVYVWELGEWQAQPKRRPPSQPISPSHPIAQFISCFGVAGNVGHERSFNHGARAIDLITELLPVRIIQHLLSIQDFADELRSAPCEREFTFLAFYVLLVGRGFEHEGGHDLDDVGAERGLITGEVAEGMQT